MFTKTKRWFSSLTKTWSNNAYDALKKDIKDQHFKLAKKMLNIYKTKTNLVGLIFPTSLTFLPLVLPKSDDIQNNIIKNILIYYPYILFFFFLFLLIYWTIKINIWQSVCDIISVEEYNGIVNEKTYLLEKIDSLELEKNRLNKIYIILNSLVRKIKEKAPNKELTRIIAQDILNSLGNDNRYSVGIYETTGGRFWMPCYETNMINYDVPKLYSNGVARKNNIMYKEYCFYKFLHSKKGGKKIFANKKEIEINFFNASEEYQQYGCCSLSLNKQHKILLEIISYDIVDNFEENVIKIFDQYIPLLKLIFGIEMSSELKNKVAI